MTTEKLPPVNRGTCGSYAGYKAHRKHNEIVCDFCKAARNAWEKGRREARDTAQVRATLTGEERLALSDVYAHGGDVVAYVEGLIADRLIRYT